MLPICCDARTSNKTDTFLDQDGFVLLNHTQSGRDVHEGKVPRA